MTNEEAIALYARGLSVGQHKGKCPACSDDRKKKRDPSLSVHVDNTRAVYNCHHCGVTGIVPFHERSIKIESPSINAHRVKKLQKNPLTESALNWLSSRGISAETASHFGIFSTKHWINAEGKEVDCVVFPYKVNGVDNGAKIRSVGSKGFSCTNSLKSFFNIDSVEEGDVLVICEGEMDAMAIHQSGFPSVISVPNGAVQKVSDDLVDPEQDTTFAFLWENKSILDSACKIVLATDSDKQGQAMAEELARRIGKDRCWKVEWPADCKDANDVLIKFGNDNLEGIINRAKPWPVSGIYDASHFADEVRDIYENGLTGGWSTGYDRVDELYTVVEGQLTVVTGIPSSGKSEFIDQIMMNMALRYGHKFAYCSFENEPKFHIPKLISKYHAKPFKEGETDRVSKEEVDSALEFIEDHFTFLYQADGSLSSLESILERLKVAVLRYGIRGAVIDPYNYISRPNNVPETEFVSDILTKLRVFAQGHGIHIWFVAHPTKMSRENGKVPVPKGYDISGSAAWFAKADVGMTVHREEGSSSPQIHIWKCRFSWVGKQGQTTLKYNPVTTRYEDDYFTRVYGAQKPDPDPIHCPF